MAKPKSVVKFCPAEEKSYTFKTENKNFDWLKKESGSLLLPVLLGEALDPVPGVLETLHVVDEGEPDVALRYLAIAGAR